ncbi:MAG: TRAP transporter large permease subunit, partial [Planctomycetes bacterium]|nr:TRAP transporter large permease subunit [Planctomycetota bacterium]
YSGKVGSRTIVAKEDRRPLHAFEATVFFGALTVLIVLLVLGFSPFRAVTGALILILLLTSLRPQLQMSLLPRIQALVAFAAMTAGHQFFVAEPLAVVTGRTVFESLLVSAIWGVLLGLLPIWMCFDLAGRIMSNARWKTGTTTALDKSAKAGVSLVAASACVGIIIGIVQQTGIANDFSARIAGVVETNLLLALAGIMVCSLILGMGVPSVVCYLLMATLMGGLLGEMGVVPLAAHLFIFYFGMMSMVTPPVALAGYAAASIANSPIMQTSWSAFKFSLVGFTLPYMFVYQPALLMMSPEGEELVTWRMISSAGAGEGAGSLGAALGPIALATVIAIVGITALAMALTGYFKAPLSAPSRLVLLAAAALLLSPHLMIGGTDYGMHANAVAAVVVAIIAALNWRSSQCGMRNAECEMGTSEV